METTINGDNLRKQRVKQKCSQIDVANYCGVSRQYISAIETNKRKNIHKDKLCKIALYLHCTTDYLEGKVSSPENHIGPKVIRIEHDEIIYKDAELSPQDSVFYPYDFTNELKHKLPYLYDSELLYLNKTIDILIATRNSSENRATLFTFLDYISSKSECAKTRPIKKPSDYIYSQLQNEILPSLVTEASNFINSDERLQTLPFFKHSKNSIDFKKSHIDRCLSRFREDIKDQVRCTIKECCSIFMEDLPASSTATITSTSINYILEYILEYIYLKLKRHTSSPEFSKNLPRVTSSQKQEILEDLQESLLLNQKQYLTPLENLLDSFFQKGV